MSRIEAAPAEAVYHAGQLAVQARAGVAAEAEDLARIVRPTLPGPAVAFLGVQRLLILASVGADGRPWASALVGPSGFARAEDERTVRVAPGSAPGDPWRENVRATDAVGLLVVDFAQRRRLRINGRGEVEPDGTLTLRVERVFGNCPSYIHPRVIDATPTRFEAMEPSRSGALADAQRAWIQGADTCFLATGRPDGGAEASHRGGPAGFVRAPSAARIVWPDYAGNNMFLSLGNLEATGRAGLLFLDLEAGRTLQVSGRGRIDWHPQGAAAVPGAARLVELDVEAVVESRLPVALLSRGEGALPGE